MRTKEREALNERSYQTFLSILRRFSQVKEVVPWLRPGLSHSALRRTVARLRSGAIRSIDPRIPASALAAVIEKSIAQDELIKSIAMEMNEERQMRRTIEEMEKADRIRAIVAGF